MKYAYEDLSPAQFEVLVVAMCQFLLGAGVQGFADGPDGGRDAKFVGTAELLPSKAAPWKGIIIIQAKHTNGYNKSCSDTDFYGAENKSSTLILEAPKITKLRTDKKLDVYMLFSNRRLTANADEVIRKFISTTCGLAPNHVYVCGVEQIEIWLARFPEAARIADIDPIDSPLLVSSDYLSEVVEHLAAQLKPIAQTPTPPADRVAYEQKNILNGMTPEYAKALRKRYLKDAKQIEAFLAAPENERSARLYESAVDEFQVNILAKRKAHQSFDDLFVYLRNLLIDRDPVLRANPRVTSALLWYMYWRCDLGVNHGD